MRCPSCGSERISSRVVTEIIEKEKIKGFGWIKACIGFLLFQIPGILCGLCGMGKGKRHTTTINRTVYRCENCGREW